ncbi:UNKNOWN [Stylonychia lemnae]|uniref:Transmembrane protein n=1 Tax=Stylonychia lemnae TaxID=5949 RepID=A0A077ZSV3_STYLE|nr:UNKNOWN [Stylonychia lemnae]|eukprot:CDW72634.1 UNKNOWN [Stylonychia lemnae]
MSSCKKAIVLETNFAYFLFVLLIRGSASAFFKSGMLSILLKEQFTAEKAKKNLFQNTLPTIFVYSLRVLNRIIWQKYSTEIVNEDSLIQTFMIYMVMSRCLTTLYKILRKTKSADIKNQKPNAISSPKQEDLCQAQKISILQKSDMANESLSNLMMSQKKFQIQEQQDLSLFQCLGIDQSDKFIATNIISKNNRLYNESINSKQSRKLNNNLRKRTQFRY